MGKRDTIVGVKVIFVIFAVLGLGTSVTTVVFKGSNLIQKSRGKAQRLNSVVGSRLQSVNSEDLDMLTSYIDESGWLEADLSSLDTDQQKRAAIDKARPIFANKAREEQNTFWDEFVLPIAGIFAWIFGKILSPILTGFGEGIGRWLGLNEEKVTNDQ